MVKRFYSYTAVVNPFKMVLLTITNIDELVRHGLQYFNDTVGTERNYKVDKITFQSSSRRKSSVFREMHERNVQRRRIETFTHMRTKGREARSDSKVDDNTVFETIDKDGGRIALLITDDQWHLVQCQCSFLHHQIEISTVTNLLVTEVTSFSDFHHDLIAKMICPGENSLRIPFIKGISCAPSVIWFVRFPGVCDDKVF